jgi:predicted dehydrogenase
VTKSGERLKVAIVGASWGVVAHLPAWRALAAEVEVIGIMASREESATAAAQAHDLPRAYWDIDALCADAEIDIVDMGTQPRTRQAMVEAVLASGKHCFCGMPFATDARWSRRLLDAQEKAGVAGMVDATIQAVPAIARMKELIDEGAIGDIWFAQTSFNQQLFNQPPAHWPYMWFADAGSGASALRNLGAHALHSLVHMLGPIVEAVGSNERYLDRWKFPRGQTIRPRTPDTAGALFRFESGALAALMTSWVAADAAGWSLEVSGSNGRLLALGSPFPTAQGTRLYHGPVSGSYVPIGDWIEIPNRLMTLPRSLLDPACPERAAVVARRPGPQDIVMGRMFRAFGEAIRAGTPAGPDFAQAHHVQQVVEAICRSDESRRWEPVLE